MQTNAPRPFICIFSKLREADYFTSICISFPQWGQVTEVFLVSFSSLTSSETVRPNVVAIRMRVGNDGFEIIELRLEGNIPILFENSFFVYPNSLILVSIIFLISIILFYNL